MRIFPWISGLLAILLLCLLGSSCQAATPESTLPPQTGFPTTPTSSPERSTTRTPTPNPEHSLSSGSSQVSEIKQTPPLPGKLILGETLLREKDQSILVAVPAGQFKMGTTEEEIAYALTLCEAFNQNCDYIRTSQLSRPAHFVRISGFWIDQHEITNAQFAAFLNDQGNQVEDRATWLSIDNPHSLIELVNDTYQPKNGNAEHPVIEVTWYGASAYCQWAGGRLPTEAEWEYAARGPESLVFPWGDTFDLTRLNFCDTNCEKFWKTEDYDTGYSDGYAMTAPVGSYPEGASWCGALDMAGNVHEWMADWMGPYSLNKQENPSGPETGTIKVLKGGAWCNAPTIFRSSHRWNYAPLGSGFNLGFRCVVPQAGPADH